MYSPAPRAATCGRIFLPSEMPSTQSLVEYVANTRIGEKGQLTIPKEYRDQLGLDTGAPIAVLRVGDALILIPEHDRFSALCASITDVLEHRGVSQTDLLDTLPATRERVFARRYPTLGRQARGGARRPDKGR